MKKKVALIIFTIVCTIGLTASIASFTLGMTDTPGTSGDNTGNALSGIYDSYLTQVQHIVDNSNINESSFSSDEEMKKQTEYHIVLIVDNEANASDANNKLKAYIDFENDEDKKDASGDSIALNNFRTQVIDAKMKNKKIDLQTYVVSDSALATAITNADLIYISSTGKYSSSKDLSSTALTALETYALSQFKPVLIDSDTVGVSRGAAVETTEHSTKIYDFLLDYYDTINKSVISDQHGVAAVKKKGITWNQYFDESNPNTTYITFDNTGTDKHNTFDYDNYVHKVLEIKLDDKNDTHTTNEYNTDFGKCIENGNFNNAFAKPDKVAAKNINYECVSLSEFNKMVADAISKGTDPSKVLYGYDFVCVSHESNDKILYYNSETDNLDITLNAKTALKGFHDKAVNTNGEPASGEATSSGAYDWPNRLIVDENFFKQYVYNTNGGSSTGGVDTSSSMYKFATKLISSDAKTTYIKNVEIAYNGFFSDMTDEKAQKVTDLINRSTYRDYTASQNGATFKVLEIEPYYTPGLDKDGKVKTSWYNTNAGTLSNTLENPASQEEYEVSNTKGTDTPYYRFNITQARIAAATGLNVNQISVTSMSANALCSTSPELLEDYDMIYIGNNHAAVKAKEDWHIWDPLNHVGQGQLIFLSKNPKDYPISDNTTKDNAFVYVGYTHTGDIGGRTTDQAKDVFQMAGGEIKNSASRTNGSDITAKMYGKLYAYIKAGMPVVCDKEVLSSEYLIGGASKNANLVENSNIRITYDSESQAGFSGLCLAKTQKMETLGNKAYNYSYYSDDTMTARRESKIDPESYMYQLMYKIAVDKNSGIYHAANVYAGFDTNDTTTDLKNLYVEGTTLDTDDTTPDDIASNSKAKKIVSGLSENDKYTLFSNKKGSSMETSGSGRKLKNFLNLHATTRPIINMVEKPVDYDFDRDNNPDTRIVNSRKPIYKFYVTGDTSTTYTVRLYYDLNGDGKFSDAIKGATASDPTNEGRLEGQLYNTEKVAEMTDYTVGSSGIIEFKTGSKYTNIKENPIDLFTIDDSFVGVMPYKLVVIDNNTKKRSSVTGYPKYFAKSKDAKLKLNILNLIPGNANAEMGAINGKVNTLCANENTLGNGQKIGQNDKDGHHVFGLNSTKGGNLAESLIGSGGEYDINLDIMTTGQFNEMAFAYLEDYCRNFAAYSEEDGLSDTEKKNFEDKFMNKYYSGDIDGGIKNDFLEICNINNETYYNFEEQFGLCDKILNGWLLKGRYTSNTDGESKAKSLAISTKDYNNKVQKFDLSGYDCIVIGFTSQMGGAGGSNTQNSDIKNISCQFMRSYIENYGSVVLGRDTTSWRDFSSAGDLYWSRNINRYLRESFGMDRFKLEDNTVPDTGVYTDSGVASNAGGEYVFTPYYTKKTKDQTQTLPGEFFTTNSYDGTYEKGFGGQAYMARAGGTDILVYSHSEHNSTIFNDVNVPKTRSEMLPTTRIARNNIGLITSYPFNISSYPKISSTAAQYFALDTEDDEMKIWYTLAGAKQGDGNLYAADPLNGRSFYYIYTYKNVTYTGAGYQDIMAANDNDDERKLIINSILCNSKIHRAGPSVVFSKTSLDMDEDLKGEFTDASSDSDAKLVCKGKEKKYCNFDVTINIGSNKNLKSAVMFIDVDEDGKYSKDTDIEIKTFDTKTIETGKPIQIKGENLNEIVSSYMNQGPFKITVAATDSSGATGFARLLITSKSKLFELN